MRDFLAPIEPKIRSLVNLIVNSGLVKQTITYKQYSHEAFDATVGYGRVYFTDHTGISAARISHSVKSAAQLKGSEVQAGDLLYLVRMEDLPSNANTACTLKDEIQDGSDTLKIVDIQWVFSFGALFTCKGKS